MTTTANKRSAAGGKIRGRSRRLLVSVALLGGALAAAGMVGFLWRQAVRSHPAPGEAAVPEPPVIELAGVDPAVLRAIEAARAAVNRSPLSARAWGQLGKTLLAHDFHLPGDTCLAQAERLDPGEPRWSYLQGIALASADPPDPGAAIQKFQRAVALGGDAPDALRLRLGEALLGQDRLEEAEEQFQRVLQRHPANARAHLGLARVAHRRGDPETSRGHLDHAVRDPRTKKAARLLLAEVRQRLGKEPSAEELHEASRLPEDSAWPDPFWQDVTQLKTGMKTYLNRAEKLLRQGRVPEAITLLQQTVRDYPESNWAWLLFGKALVRRRDLQAAEQALRTALKLGPDSVEAQFHLGVALFLQGDPRAAGALFRSATQAKPDFAMAHYDLGHCLLQQGDQAGAIEAFRAALRCEPDFADAHTSLGELLAKSGQNAEAFAHARLALQSKPADAPAKKLVQRLLLQITVPAGP